MKLEDQVCSLELAKRLKELGVKQESLFYWGCGQAGNKIIDRKDRFMDWIQPVNFYSAFTVSELGEFFISYPIVTRLIGGIDGDWTAYGLYDLKDMPDSQIAKTEADARAKMLIYLIEQGLVKP